MGTTNQFMRKCKLGQLALAISSKTANMHILRAINFSSREMPKRNFYTLTQDFYGSDTCNNEKPEAT